jgi:hypothetical protein
MHDLLKKIRFGWLTVAFVLASLVMQLRIFDWEQYNDIPENVRRNYACLPALLGKTDASAPSEGATEVSCETCPARVGMTVSYLPFFLGAHGFAILSGHEADGYSSPYLSALRLSSVVFLIIGLLFVHRTLRLFFPEYIVTLALICICFGSNVLYFVNMAAGSSHVVGFMLIAAFVYYTIQWHQDRDLRSSLIIGLLGGLLALTRPVDLWIFIFFILYEVKSLRGFSYKLKLFGRHAGKLALTAAVTVAMYLLQPLACSLMCGGDPETCAATDPSVTPSLAILRFSPGLLIYAPLLLFSLGGFFSLGGYMMKFLVPCLVFFAMYTAAAFIWWNTPYAGTFGYRTLIDVYPVLAIPFCALLSKMLNLGSFTRVTLYVLLIIFMSLNTWITISLASSPR